MSLSKAYVDEIEIEIQAHASELEAEFQREWNAAEIEARAAMMLLSASNEEQDRFRMEEPELFERVNANVKRLRKLLKMSRGGERRTYG